MTEKFAEVFIGHRFHGPPSSGNGGYVCGVIAGFLGGPAEATLRAPPPLDTSLDVVRDGDDVLLCQASREIARARPANPSVTPPPAPARAEAERASALFVGHATHIFPGCFTCGPARAEGDGLRLFPGPLGTGSVAAPWTPGPELAGGGGSVAPEFLWAALDCPSYWALPGAGTLTAVLGRLTASIVRAPATGDPLVVVAWPLGSSGRKHHAASAIFDPAGELVAIGEAIWIAVQHEQFA